MHPAKIIFYDNLIKIAVYRPCDGDPESTIPDLAVLLPEGELKNAAHTASNFVFLAKYKAAVKGEPYKRLFDYYVIPADYNPPGLGFLYEVGRYRLRIASFEESGEVEEIYIGPTWAAYKIYWQPPLHIDPDTAQTIFN